MKLNKIIRLELRSRPRGSHPRPGMARDINGRDRDINLPRPRRDRDVENFCRVKTFRFRDDIKTRRLQASMRDRDDEMHVVINQYFIQPPDRSRGNKGCLVDVVQPRESVV